MKWTRGSFFLYLKNHWIRDRILYRIEYKLSIEKGRPLRIIRVRRLFWSQNRK